MTCHDSHPDPALPTLLPTINFRARCLKRIMVAAAGLARISLCLAIGSPCGECVVAAREPWTTSRIQGSPEPPAPYRIVPAFPGVRFEKPTCIEEMPDGKRMLITEIEGRILSFQKSPDVKRVDVVVDLRDLLPSDLADHDVPLFDVELHPKFRENRYIFVCYVHPGNGGHTRVSRFTLSSESAPRVIPGSERVLITWPPGPHNAGCLEFGTDGYLYISTGDGTGPNPPDGLTTGQDISDLLGAILRIDVDRASDDRAYSVPSDNPFFDLDAARPEIWAYGLRNPWKFGIDRETGSIFAADNGWESWEMVHRIVRGGNCGWPVMEGRARLRSEVAPGPTPIIPPVKDHSHTEANSVIGGPVYRGDKLPDLVGSFVYGDYITGTIWAIRPNQADAYSHRTLVDTDQRIVAFTEGSKGELYVLDYDFTGQIYELLPSGLEDTSADFPRRLSQTGLFTSLESMQPSPGVVPYHVRVDRWMDGAHAQRWVAIPGVAHISLAAHQDDPTVWPEGTVLVKHLTLPLREGQTPLPLETQILHYENQSWRPYSYLWDDAGVDAELVDSIGADRPIQIPDVTGKAGLSERTWHVSATNECKLCHNAGSRFVLGFSSHQLNRSATGMHGGSANQLSFLATRGVIGSAHSIADDDPSRLVDPHDTSQTLDDRARSYLHVNCGMCHHPGGNAIVSFYLRRDLPFEQLNTNKSTIIGTFGMQDPKIIVPGDPYRSLLLYRMAKLGYARMPYIGSQVVDGAGVALVEEWIRSLADDSAQTVSGPASSGSSLSKALQSLVNRRAGNRDIAIDQLLKSTEGTLALIGQMHRGSLMEDDFRAAVAKGRDAPTSDIRGLLETFVPEVERRARLGASIHPRTILSQQGDYERGKLIYFSDVARCQACHQVDDTANSLGPTLVEINTKYPRRSEMLQHVLQPSLKIDDPFAAYSIFTTSGQVVTGLNVGMNDDEVLIKTAEKKIERIARDRIDEIQKSQTSLMPQRLLSDLTAQEAADLLEYVRSQRK